MISWLVLGVVHDTRNGNAGSFVYLVKQVGAGVLCKCLTQS